MQKDTDKQTIEAVISQQHNNSNNQKESLKL